MSSERWHVIWSSRSALAVLLWPISLLYGALGAMRRGLYRTHLLKTHRLPVPVVVVGNVVVGGAGKTPTVIAMVQHLQAQGWHPGVVSRGYGRSSQAAKAVLEVLDDTAALSSGDEPLLIRRTTQIPVFVSARRVDAARALLAAHPAVNLLLCDDGLQHHALGRDLSVVVFDDRGTGNGWQLPAGLLREPWPPAEHSPFRPDLQLHQRRADAGEPVPAPVAGPPAYTATRRLADQAVGAQGQRLALSALSERSVVAVAGIARPDVFFDMLRARGLRLSRTVALPDHAKASDYAALHFAATDTVVCTEKDAVKLFAQLAPGVEVWAVPLEMTPEPAFWTAFDALLAQKVIRR